MARVEHGPGLDSLTPERTFHNRRHHHDNNSNHRHDLDSCDPLRRSPHGRHLSHRPSHSVRTCYITTPPIVIKFLVLPLNFFTFELFVIFKFLESNYNNNKSGCGQSL